MVLYHDKDRLHGRGGNYIDRQKSLKVITVKTKKRQVKDRIDDKPIAIYLKEEEESFASEESSSNDDGG